MFFSLFEVILFVKKNPNKILPGQRNGITEVKMADGGDRQPLPKTLHSMNAYLG